MEARIVKHWQVKNHNRKAVLLTIPMADGALEILERWKGRNENFVFGMLDDEFDLSDEEEFMRVKQSRTRTISSVMTTEKVYATVLQETLQKTVDESMNFQL